MNKGKSKFGKDKILGFLSLMFLFLEIYGIYFFIQQGSFGSFLDYIFLIVFCYATYKTLIKKEKLKKWEVYLVIISIIIVILGALVGLFFSYTFLTLT